MRLPNAVLFRTRQGSTRPSSCQGSTCNHSSDLHFVSDSYLSRFQSDLDDREFQRLAWSVALQNTLHRPRPTPSQPLSNTNGILNRHYWTLGSTVSSMLYGQSRSRARNHTSVEPNLLAWMGGLKEVALSSKVLANNLSLSGSHRRRRFERRYALSHTHAHTDTDTDTPVMGE